MSHFYITTQIFAAVYMTKGKYCQLVKWDLPSTENPRDKGYMVTYKDGHKGWIPKKLFEANVIELPDISKLEPYQQRLLGERAQLESKLAKIKDAINRPTFGLLPALERGLLVSQSRAMGQYLARLNDRINLFYKEELDTK